MTLPTLGWIDWSLLAVLTLSVLIGLWRGLVFELMSLLGWVVAYIVAQAFSPALGTYIPIGTPGSALHQGVAFAITFVLALVVWSLLARLVRLVIHATPLTLPDRALGGAFGLLRGVVLLLVVATLVTFTPAARSAAWTDSKGAAWLGSLLKGLKPVLPAEIVRHLPA
ncbi:CvpA family protein [Pseudaquabacterium terrae]|uniref:CvpA family protein n=1 Tax=Pseudaquabacterium terrae TaxID=2732868 RepID=UPI001FE7AA1A|nr:CvpA family protein [Aquabacterium terrae]